MKNLSLLVVLLFPVLVLGDVSNSDSGIHGPEYSQILQTMDRLGQEHSDLVTIHEYGKSVKGEPLRLLAIKKSLAVLENRPAIFFSGATHGNEYLNIADRLPELLLKASKIPGSVKTYLNHGGVILIVPILNPDGYMSRSRYNANGVDLNRDWHVPPAEFEGLKEIETRTLAQTVDKLVTDFNLQLKVTVDYHCCYGALLTPWSYKDEKLPEPDYSAHHNIGNMAKRHLDIIEVGSTGEVLGYYPMGTTKDYYYSLYGALAYTYEGVYRTEKDKLSQHLNWWEEIMDGLIERQPNALATLIPRLQLTPGS